MNSGRRQILQVAKISQPCKIFVVVLFLMFSTPLSFWLLTCNSEFNSDLLGFVMI